MFQILSYSGLSTKAKAMSGKLLKPAQYEQLISCGSVSDALLFLKQLPGYRSAFLDLDEMSSHRGSIEARLMDSLYQDFSRLYHFANPTQRNFLDLYFMHFEVNYLKDCLRSAFAGTDTVDELPCFENFFNKRSKLNFRALAAATDIEQFVQALQGTVFYAPIERIHRSEFRSLFDYETGLDQFFFSFVWKAKDKIFGKKEREILAAEYGQRIDLLNIQWIMRAKRFYKMSTAELYAMVIPCYCHLKPKDIAAMVETSSFEELIAVISEGYYGRKYKDRIGEIQSIEKMYIALLEHINDLAGRKNPYSIAPINAYLYNKEHEIHRITSVLEGIRYGLVRRELAAYINY